MKEGKMMVGVDTLCIWSELARWKHKILREFLSVAFDILCEIEDEVIL